MPLFHWDWLHLVLVLAASDIRLYKDLFFLLSLCLYVLMLVFQRNAQLNSSVGLEATEQPCSLGLALPC